MPANFINTSGNITANSGNFSILTANSGNFESLTINNNPIGEGGAIINNYGDNRLLTSDGTSTGINAESSVTFDGTTFNIDGVHRVYNSSGTGNAYTTYANPDKNWYVGIRGDTSDTFCLSDDSAIRLAVDTSGNIGIGTTQPVGVSSQGRALHVYNDANTGNVSSNSYIGIQSVNRNSVIELCGSANATNALTFSTSFGTQLAAMCGDIANQAIFFRTGGTSERMRITSAGNLGVGTNSPQARLHQYSTNDGVQAIFTGAQTANTQSILFRSSYHTNNGTAGFANIGWIDNASQGGHLTFGTTSDSSGTTGIPTERMRITSSGDVGIGTNTPLRRLTISGGGFAFVDSGGASRTIHWGNTDNTFPVTISGNATTGNCYLSFLTNTFGNGATERMRIDSSGNVGIGTASPTHRLEVVKSSPSSLGAIARFYHGPSSDRSFEIGVHETTPFPVYIQARNTGTTTNTISIQPYGGNVGIGTNNPSNTLDVRGGEIYKTTTDFVFGTTGSLLSIYNGASTGNVYSAIGSLSSGGSAWNNLVLQAGGGNVGIGTLSPTSKVHIAGSVSYGQLRLSPTSNNGESAMAFFQDAAATDTNDAWIIGQGCWGHTGDFVIGNENNGAGGNVRLLIEKGGNVGIGTVTPLTTLHITGALRLGDWTSFTFTDGNGRASWYGNAVTNTYLQSEAASRITQGIGNISFHTAAAGTAGGAITWNHRFNLDDTGAAWIKSSRAWNDSVPTLSIGNDGDARLQTRHIWGKNASSTAAEALFLQHGNTSQHVQIGATGGGNNLYVVGDIYTNGYFTGNLVLNASNYTTYTVTKTGTGASGTWGISVTGNAGTATSISGFNNPTAAATANTIVYRDANADTNIRYLYSQFVNMSHAAGTRSSDTVFYSSTDDFIRKTNATGMRASLNVPTRTGGDASGTWGITITGTARGLDSSHYISRTGSSGNANTDFSNTPAGTTRISGDDANLTNGPGGSWWFYQHMRHYNSTNLWGVQVAWGWEDNANILRTRNVSGGAFGSWVTYLNSVNYNSYSPTLTGGGASGTWGISITGSAASLTSGNKTIAGNLTVSNGTLRAGEFVGGWGQFGSTVEFRTDGNGLQDGPRLWYHKAAAKWWAAGIQGGGSNGYAIWEDGSTSQWGTERFRIDPGGRVNMPIGWDTSGRCYSREWIEFPNHSGLYSPLNGAHFYPNNASYGPWRIAGTRNGWSGLEFDSTGAGNTSLMMNSGHTGVHNNTYGWQWYWTAGTLYVSKATYGGGTVATVLDTSNSVRAWCTFNGGLPLNVASAAQASFNVTSVTRTGNGTYTVTLSSAAGTANGAVVSTDIFTSRVGSVSGGSIVVTTLNASGTLTNAGTVYVIVT